MFYAFISGLALGFGIGVLSALVVILGKVSEDLHEAMESAQR